MYFLSRKPFSFVPPSPPPEAPEKNGFLPSGIEVVVDPERLRPIDADLQVPDTSKFRAHTGWEPEIPFETTMRDLLGYSRVRIAKGQAFLTR